MNEDMQDFPRWRRDVALFLTGQTISLFGSMIVQYAIMWHLTLLTGSGTVLALAGVLGFVPQAIVSIFGGVWADRVNRKLLIIGADGTIAVTTLVLAVLMLTGFDSLWLIYVTLAIRSAGAGVQTPAVSAFIPQITPERKLMRVNGINNSVQPAMMLIAPAIAGAILANMSIVTVFLIDVVTAVIGIAFMIAIPVRRAVTRAGDDLPGYFDDLVEGARYTFRHELVRWVLVFFAVMMLLADAPSYVTVLIITRTFDGGVLELTINELAFSLGMIIGGSIQAVAAARWNRVLAMMIGGMATALLCIALGLGPDLLAFYALMLGAGISVSFFSTPGMTLLQEQVEKDRQGRVFGFVSIVTAVAMPVGMAISGPLADVVSAETVIVVAGVLMVVIVAILTAVPSGRRAIHAGKAPQDPPRNEDDFPV